MVRMEQEAERLRKCYEEQVLQTTALDRKLAAILERVECDGVGDNDGFFELTAPERQLTPQKEQGDG